MKTIRLMAIAIFSMFVAAPLYAADSGNHDGATPRATPTSLTESNAPRVAQPGEYAVVNITQLPLKFKHLASFASRDLDCSPAEIIEASNWEDYVEVVAPKGTKFAATCGGSA